MIKAIIFDCFGVLTDGEPKNLGLLGYIAELKKTYKIGMISNVTSDWIKQEFLTKPEQALFDDMVFSHEVGVAKPDPKIFELACKNLGVEFNQAVLVDDSASYCEAARSLGMQAIVYKDFEQTKKELGPLLNLNN